MAHSATLARRRVRVRRRPPRPALRTTENDAVLLPGLLPRALDGVIIRTSLTWARLMPHSHADEARSCE